MTAKTVFYILLALIAASVLLLGVGAWQLLADTTAIVKVCGLGTVAGNVLLIRLNVQKLRACAAELKLTAPFR